MGENPLINAFRQSNTSNVYTSPSSQSLQPNIFKSGVTAPSGGSLTGDDFRAFVSQKPSSPAPSPSAPAYFPSPSSFPQPSSSFSKPFPTFPSHPASSSSSRSFSPSLNTFSPSPVLVSSKSFGSIFPPSSSVNSQPALPRANFGSGASSPMLDERMNYSSPSSLETSLSNLSFNLNAKPFETKEGVGNNFDFGINKRNQGEGTKTDPRGEFSSGMSFGLTGQLFGASANLPSSSPWSTLNSQNGGASQFKSTAALFASNGDQSAETPVSYESRSNLGGSLFGSGDKIATSEAGGSSLFGEKNVTSEAGSSLFGDGDKKTTSEAGRSSSLFGSGDKTSTSESGRSSLFGYKDKTSTSEASRSSSLFGEGDKKTTSEAGSSSLFGEKDKTPNTEAGSSSLFGEKDKTSNTEAGGISLLGDGDKKTTSEAGGISLLGDGDKKTTSEAGLFSNLFGDGEEKVKSEDFDANPSSITEKKIVQALKISAPENDGTDTSRAENEMEQQEASLPHDEGNCSPFGETQKSDDVYDSDFSQDSFCSDYFGKTASYEVWEPRPGAGDSNRRDGPSAKDGSDGADEGADELAKEKKIAGVETAKLCRDWEAVEFKSETFTFVPLTLPTEELMALLQKDEYEKMY